jgi:predicted nucleic acid-binding Zn ribbon protein
VTDSADDGGAGKRRLTPAEAEALTEQIRRALDSRQADASSFADSVLEEGWDRACQARDDALTAWETPWRQRRCALCGNLVRGPGRRFCSADCRSLWWYRFVYSETQEHRAYVIPVAARCAHCGQEFVGGRNDARYCSGRCRTAAYRARNT